MDNRIFGMMFQKLFTYDEFDKAIKFSTEYFKPNKEEMQEYANMMIETYGSKEKFIDSVNSEIVFRSSLPLCSSLMSLLSLAGIRSEVIGMNSSIILIAACEYARLTGDEDRCEEIMERNKTNGNSIMYFHINYCGNDSIWEAISTKFKNKEFAGIYSDKHRDAWIRITPNPNYDSIIHLIDIGTRYI